jgi:hypothetical protein
MDRRSELGSPSYVVQSAIFLITMTAGRQINTVAVSLAAQVLGTNQSSITLRRPQVLPLGESALLIWV